MFKCNCAYFWLFRGASFYLGGSSSFKCYNYHSSFHPLSKKPSLFCGQSRAGRGTCRKCQRPVNTAVATVTRAGVLLVDALMVKYSQDCRQDMSSTPRSRPFSGRECSPCNLAEHLHSAQQSRPVVSDWAHASLGSPFGCFSLKCSTLWWLCTTLIQLTKRSNENLWKSPIPVNELFGVQVKY